MPTPSCQPHVLPSCPPPPPPLSVFHHIGDTHVLHHIFSAMPFYHAEEASAAMKPILGDYYRFDSTPIAQALWRETGECRYVSWRRGTGGGMSEGAPV